MSETNTKVRKLMREILRLEAQIRMMSGAELRAQNAAKAAEMFEKQANEAAFSSRAYLAVFMDRDDGGVTLKREEIEAAFAKAVRVTHEVSEDGETVRYFYQPEAPVVVAEEAKTEDGSPEGTAKKSLTVAEAREPETPPRPIEEESELDEPEPAEMSAVAEGF